MRVSVRNRNARTAKCAQIAFFCVEGRCFPLIYLEYRTARSGISGAAPEMHCEMCSNQNVLEVRIFLLSIWGPCCAKWKCGGLPRNKKSTGTENTIITPADSASTHSFSMAVSTSAPGSAVALLLNHKQHDNNELTAAARARLGLANNDAHVAPVVACGGLGVAVT